jgi:hypothetical protein
MQSWVRRVVALASLLVLIVAFAGRVAAQGVTSASINGLVTQDGGQGLEGATVVVTNTATGQRFQVITRTAGRFNIENLPPGGPYTVEVRAIGYQAGRRTGVRLELGERYASDFALKAAVVEVQEVVVTAGVDPLINRGRTGAASSVSGLAIASLPTPGRNFTDLIATSPVVAAGPGGRPSIMGTNNRYNSIQVDGSVNNDLFGLGSTGAPGGQTGGRAVPLDAVKEFQVLVAPFDVRQGGFTGGIVNAITKSGENTYSGSVFLSRQTDALVSSTPLPAQSSFSLTDFGATFGGPIVKNKAHFFGSIDRQLSTTPYSDILVGQDFDTTGNAGGIRCDAVATRIRALGGDPGSCYGFDMDNPTWNMFGKVTTQAGANGQVEFSLNYASSEQQTIARASNRDYQLTGGGYIIHNNNLTPRFKWTSIFGGRFNNEFIGGYSRIRDTRDPNQTFPTIVVITGAGYNLVSGAEAFSQANILNQDVFELSDNVSFDVGKHRLLFGTHNEFFGFHNVFFPLETGRWTFSSLAAFQNDSATSFERNVPAAAAGIAGGRGDGPIADFSVRQWGLYAQDQWSPLKNLTLTAGIRADVPTFPLTPPTNVKLLTAFGSEFDTGVFPSGNIHWSPRLGFNYDLGGTGTTIVRGGAGVFTGRPPYVWVSNAYANSGLEQARLFCNTPATVPSFALFGLDPENQPTSCKTGSGATQSVPDINLFAKDFKFPQSFRANLGADKQLLWGMVATVDLMYSNAFNSMYITDYNLTGVANGNGVWPDTGTGHLTGEGNRITYGNTTTAVAQRVTPNFRYVLKHENRGLDYSYAGVFQLQKRFSNSVEFNAGYTYGHSYDMISATSSIAASNYGFATLDGPLTNRNLRTSAFDRPNKITISGTAHLPYNFDVSLLYVGISGTPYAYVVAGDANADGVGTSANLTGQQNDLFYVPKDINDISFSTIVDASPTLKQAAYDSLVNYMNTDKCLADQKGQIMKRNSCRNPWQTFLNANVAWSVNTYRGHRLSVSLGLFNVLHLLNQDWGLVKETSPFEGVSLVQRVGFDATNQRNRYSLAMPIYQQLNRNASRGRALVGAKYTF